MARKGNPISVRLDPNRSSGPRRTYSSSLYFLLLKWIPFFQIFIFAFLVFFRLVLPILQVVTQFTSSSYFLVSLPPEIQNPQALAHLEGLNFYLSLYDQDPEWVAFIQQELNHNTPLEDIPGRLRLFLIEEKISCLRRDLIQDFISLYNRNEALLPLEPYILEEAVRSYLSHIHASDNMSILQTSYQDMQRNEGQSLFFQTVVSHNQDYLDAQTTSRRLIEEARRMRWEGISSSQAQLERTEHDHALLIFALYDQERGDN